MQSSYLQAKVREHIFKVAFGTTPEERRAEYDAGLLDEMGVLVYDHHAVTERKDYVQRIKIKEFRKQLVNAFSTQLYNMIDVDEFVKREIETKGIVVIDEIDKLAQPVRDCY